MAVRSVVLSGVTGGVVALVLLSAVPRVASLLADPSPCDSIVCRVGQVVEFLAYAGLVLLAAVPVGVGLSWGALRLMRVPRALVVTVAGTATTALVVGVGAQTAPGSDLMSPSIPVVTAVAFAAWGGILGRGREGQARAAR